MILNNHYHRESGPAIICSNSTRSWYYKGCGYSGFRNETWLEKVKQLKREETLEIFK